MEPDLALKPRLKIDTERLNSCYSPLKLCYYSTEGKHEKQPNIEAIVTFR